jgi:C-terminal processing protease CtpA/Prc
MLSNTDFMGIIGNDILDDFHIIFDQKKEKIWIKRNKNFNKNKKKLFRGISFLDNGEKWVVAGIVEDTEAYKNGVRMNDQILKINNISVEQINLDKFVDKLKANDVLNLKIKRDDEERDIKFKLNVFLKT